VGAYPPGEAEFTFEQGSAPERVDLASYRVRDLYRRTMLLRQRVDEERYSLRMTSPPADQKPQGGDDAAGRAMRKAMREARPLDFLFMGADIRRAGLRARSGLDAPEFSFSIGDERVRLYTQITDFVYWELESITDELNYIGPLREPPKRVYELSGEMPADVGTRGEYAPEIVYRWRDESERLDQVKHWLSRFGFHKELAYEAAGAGGFSLLLSPGNTNAPTSVIDLGFGVSQVLPLIVQGLKSAPSSWIISEQPEIHLNPRLQATLADLFAFFVSQEVGLIVETHSEHFLLRLRRLVAEGEIDSADVALYYVEQNNGESSVRSVPIEENGWIDPSMWPRGFFEDSLQEALALAQAQSRAQETRSA
jgi:hypothetical protein